MADVRRWGRSAYETDDALSAERSAAERLGLSWAHHPSRDVPAALSRARVLVTTSKVRVDASVIAAFGGDLVLTTTSGVDHIDVAAARVRGVRVARCPVARRDAVVEHAVEALIRGLRRLDPLEARGRVGVWARGELPGFAPRGLAGARVGVVGLGVIGARVASVLDLLGAHVIGVDPYAPHPGRPVHDLDAVLPTLDAVTLHCQLTPSSRRILDAARLARLPSHAVVVNTARGEVLDVAAAVEAVRAGVLGGLACDVFPEEPWPDLATAAAVAGVRLTPHASGYVHDLGARVAREVGEALTAWAAGDPVPHTVA